MASVIGDHDADIVIVGAGFFGATIAERCAALGVRCLVLDRRLHPGGNSFSAPERETGIEVHRYGPHIFHTPNPEIWSYVRRFAAFNGYVHRVLTMRDGRLYPMPINLSTIARFYGLQLTPGSARAMIAQETSAYDGRAADNFEDKALSLVGRPLYEAFIRDYSAKQWQTSPRALPAHIITRLPVRYTYNDRYFDDAYEGIPLDGYGSIFRKMLNHRLIRLVLGTDYFSLRPHLRADIPVVFTGPIDRYFDHVAGPLGWRTLRFEQEVVRTAPYQATAVVNCADPHVPHTRVVEYRHFHPERDYPPDATVIAREYPRHASGDDEPYYPIGTATDRARYRAYKDMASRLPNVLFGGRLGTYRYLDMHQAIGSALKLFDRVLLPYFTRHRPLAAAVAGR